MSFVQQIVIAILAVGPVSALPRQPEELSVAEWIERLGDQSSSTRELAEQRLIELGPAAKPLLEAEYDKGGTEFRRRAARLLLLIEKNEIAALEQSLEARIEPFLLDDVTVSLPGWERYREIVGADRKSKEFFVRMLRQEPRLLSAYEQGPDQAAEMFQKLWTLRHVEIYKQFPQPELQQAFQQLRQPYPTSNESLAALWLVAGDAKVELPAPSLQALVNSSDWEAIKSPDNLPLRKLVVNWVCATPDEKSSQVIAAKLQLAMGLAIEETIDWMIGVALNSQVSLEDRVTVLSAMSASIDPKTSARYIERLQPLLEETTILKSGIPLGEFVLVVFVRLSSQPWEEYHFPKNTAELLNAGTLKKVRFKNAQQRDKALAHWRAWFKEDVAWRAELAAFASDVDGAKGLSLPGWKQFRTVMGDTPQARALFVELQRSERKLLAAYEKNPESVGELVEAQLKGQQNLVGSAAALLFVASDERVRLTRIAKLRLANLAQRNDFVRGAQYPIELKILHDHWEGRDRQYKDSLNAAANSLRGLWKLPGWKQYQALAKGGHASRKFFIEMQRAEPELLAAYQQGGPAVAKEFEAVCKFYAENSFMPPWPSLATLLLIAGDDKVVIPEATLAQMCTFARSFYGREGAFNPDVFQTLLAHWIKQPASTDAIAREKVMLAVSHNLNNNLEPLLAMAENTKWQPETRAKALLGLAALGKAQRPLLVGRIEPLLSDRLAYECNKEKIELRDVVLAVLVDLWDESLLDYGFGKAEGSKLKADLDPDLLLEDPTQQIQLALAAQREPALKKWRAWSVANQAFRARVTAFAQDTAGSKQHDLPGWKRYRELAGDTPQARALFVQMQNAAPKLLESYENNRAKLGDVFQECVRRNSHLWQQCLNRSRSWNPSLGYVAAALLVAGDRDVKLVGGVEQVSANLWDEQVFKAIQTDHKIEFDKLIRPWLQRPAQGIELMGQLNVATKFELKDEAIRLAAEGLRQQVEAENPGQFWPMMEVFIVGTIGTLCDKSHASIIETMELQLEDMTLMKWYGDIPVCDYVLAVLVHMTDQNPKDYGFQYVLQADSVLPNSVVFDNNQSRVRSREKWKAWSQANVHKAE